METTYKILKLLIWVLAIAVVLAGASLLYENLSGRVAMPGVATVAPQETRDPEHTAAGTEKETNPAPDFTVYDEKGNEVKLSDFRGKPIVVNVWASTCGPCKAEMPEFQKAFEKYGDEVQFLMIDYIGFFGESVSSAQEYIGGEGYTFPVYFDSDNDAARTYGLNSIPFTMFINEDFELYTYLKGRTDFDTLEKYIKIIK